MHRSHFPDLEKLAFQCAPDATLVLRERKIMVVNQMVKFTFGWSPKELEGQSIRLLYPAQTDFEVVGARARRAMQSMLVYQDERFMRHKDGQILWMQGCGTATDQRDPQKLAIWTYRPIKLQDTKANILTPAEIRVSRYLVNGFTNKEIAISIGCSPRTVEAHRANMIRKLNVRNSVELVSKLISDT